MKLLEMYKKEKLRLIIGYGCQEGAIGVFLYRGEPHNTLLLAVRGEGTGDDYEVLTLAGDNLPAVRALADQAMLIATLGGRFVVVAPQGDCKVDDFNKVCAEINKDLLAFNKAHDARMAADFNKKSMN